MAIYDFVCEKCGAKFEVRRPMADADMPAKCPTCGAERGKRGDKIITRGLALNMENSPKEF